VQNWKMRCSVCPEEKALGRRWWIDSDRRICTTTLGRLIPALCIFLAAFLLPVAQGSELVSETQTQQQRAPTNDQQKRPEYTISVEANLVVLDVLVTDEDGNVLSGLKKGNFRVLDDDKPQVITHFAPTEDPITIVILMEYSGLAYDYFAYKAAYWGSAFLRYLDSKDWIALVTYDMKPTIQVDFTRNKTEIQDALSTLSYPGFSEANLFDAIVDTLEKLEHVNGKKAILLITTGIDTFSKATLDATIDKLKKSNVTIFCVGVAESEYMMAETRTGGSAIGYLQAKNQLQAFANLTGGLAWFPRFEGEMPGLFRSVVGFLRSEYDLGFSPSSTARDSKYHKLKVEIVGPDGNPLRVTDQKGKRRRVTVYAREGYVAAKEPVKR
jgi:VWFA-related protein